MNTPTPRTDSIWNERLFAHPFLAGEIEETREIERELAAVAKERDSLKLTTCMETCATCGAAYCPSDVEAGECIWCIAKGFKAELVTVTKERDDAYEDFNTVVKRAGAVEKFWKEKHEEAVTELNDRLIERTAAYEARERALLEEIRRLKAGEPAVTVPPQDIMHAGKFTCPKCGSHYWSLRDPSAPVEEWIGVCDGHDGNNRTCDFTWNRATQDKDVFN